MHQLFLVMLNLKSKFFRNFFFYRALWTEFFRWGSGPTLFGHAKFETKNFLEYFCLQSTLDSKFFRGGVFAPIFLGHAKFEVKKYFEIF